MKEAVQTFAWCFLISLIFVIIGALASLFLSEKAEFAFECPNTYFAVNFLDCPQQRKNAMNGNFIAFYSIFIFCMMVVTSPIIYKTTNLVKIVAYALGTTIMIFAFGQILFTFRMSKFECEKHTDFSLVKLVTQCTPEKLLTIKWFHIVYHSVCIVITCFAHFIYHFVRILTHPLFYAYNSVSGRYT